MFGFFQNKKSSSGMETLPFTMEEAKKIAQQFIGFVDIHQIAVFGDIACNQKGKEINLIFVAKDELVFSRYFDLIKLFERNDPCCCLTPRDYRMAAFSQIWGSKKTSWISCLKDRPEILPCQFDVLVLPLCWQNRIPELELKMNGKTPQTLAKLQFNVAVLATNH